MKSRFFALHYKENELEDIAFPQTDIREKNGPLMVGTTPTSPPIPSTNAKSDSNIHTQVGSIENKQENGKVLSKFYKNCKCKFSKDRNFNHPPIY